MRNPHFTGRFDVALTHVTADTVTIRHSCDEHLSLPIAGPGYQRRSEIWIPWIREVKSCPSNSKKRSNVRL